MKISIRLAILLLTSTLFFSESYSQQTKPDKSKAKTYGYWGGTSFLSNKLDKRGGLTIGIGHTPDSHFGFGAGTDLMIFSKSVKFVQAYGDFKYFIAGLDKEVTPVISFQPGYMIYKNEETKGSFCLNAMVGILAKPKKGLGLFMNLGYSNISFTANKNVTHFEGLKIELGISF